VLYYEGSSGAVQVQLINVARLVEAGTINDKTLVYSDNDNFPYADWVHWECCRHIFGFGEAKQGCQICHIVNESGEGSDEFPRSQLPGLVETGVLKDETLVYSDEANFPHDHWIAWKDVCHLFLMGSTAEEGVPPNDAGTSTQLSSAAHLRNDLVPKSTSEPKSTLEPAPESDLVEEEEPQPIIVESKVEAQPQPEPQVEPQAKPELDSNSGSIAD